MDNVTVVITSCGRTDLLEQTLESFFRYNTYPIDKVIIVEDSGVPQDFKQVAEIVSCELDIIINKENIGQVKSIDAAYAKVQTDYIFHCEEDWEFFKPGFIEKSFEILKTNPKLITVWLRGYNDTKNHAIMTEEKFDLADRDYYYLMDGARKKHWCGFTWNPGLRRTSDCMLFHPYQDLKVRKIKNGLEILGEIDLSIYYQEAGYRAAITSNEEGYVRHIGGKRHVPLPWQL
jgi:GT2 family glycosyltransferase